MEADQLIEVVVLVIVAEVEAPTRRKPDGHSEFDSEEFSRELVKAQEDKTPN